MADLALMERIEVQTNHGPCEIHLNYGSVTKLKKEDAVDVLVVSAFPGDYSPTPTSVIGALKRDLDINVRNLSRDKEEDHRRLFSCWWSKPLQGNYSFKRILCFEGSFKRGSRPPMVVSEVFRSLVSMCKEKDIKVIMPLLAAGDQGYGQKLMLRLIVETAIHWMRIGLPLKVLKIVIFSRNNSNLENDPMLKYFKELKSKWESILEDDEDQPGGHPIEYDVYLSFSTKDSQLAKQVEKKLTEKHQDIKIFSEHQNLNNELSWQEDIYKVMVTCARVITILTPEFLADEACLEQYNIALCCTRNMRRDYLAPFYVDSIDEMPTYMCLIQYIDCRPADLDKVSEACTLVVTWLQTHLGEIKHLESASKLTVCKQATQHYDVFISYSHQNSDAAHQIKNFLTLVHPDWNIFIDIAELQTGVAWQKKLYHSIEASSYVITLLSPPYLKSKVCQEEYNLASAMHTDASYQTRLIPVLVEDVERLPSWCSGYTPIDCRNISDRAKIEVVQMIDYFNKMSHLQVEDSPTIHDATSSWRTEHVQSGLKFLPDLRIEDITKFTPKEISPDEKSNNVDIMLCFHESNRNHGEFMQKRFQHYLPNCRISMPEEGKVRHNLLDDATVIVPLLSCSFTRSAELTEELNIALCRQRFNDKLVLLPIELEPLPITPAYFHLLWSLFACEDKVWTRYRPDLESGNEDRRKFSPDQKCLDFSARVVSYVLLNRDLFKGSFKTLLSCEELRSSTLRLRAKKSIDSINYNPLYFDKARDGHKVPETTAVKNCHSVTGPKKTVCDVSTNESIAEKLDVNNISATEVNQESSFQVTSDIRPKIAVEDEEVPPTKLEQSQHNLPMQERNKLPKQPSENAEDGPTEPVQMASMNEQLEDLVLKDATQASQPVSQKEEGRSGESNDSEVMAVLKEEK